MALPAVPRPTLTILPGGRRQITTSLADMEEGWVEVQAVATDAELLAHMTHEAARAIQRHLLNERPSAAIQVAHELELAAPLHFHRARHARLSAQETLDSLLPDGAA